LHVHCFTFNATHDFIEGRIRLDVAEIARLPPLLFFIPGLVEGEAM
jgi:hypothetical protein